MRYLKSDLNMTILITIMFSTSLKQKRKRMRLKNVSIIIALLLAISYWDPYAISAQTKKIGLNEESTLIDYIDYALENNPELKSAYSRWKSALERIPQAKSLPDPSLSYGYFFNEIETRVGPQRQRFGISQKFPWFGTLKLRGDIAAKNASAEFKRAESLKLKLIYNIKKTYYEYSFLTTSTSIIKENIELLDYAEQVAQSRFKTGTQLFDILKIQIERSKLEDRLKSLNEQITSITASLNALMNRDIDAPLPPPEKIPEVIMDIPEPELLEISEQNNPEILVIEDKIAGAKSNIALAKKKSKPGFAFGVNYTEIKRSIMDVDENGEDAILATLMLNLPVWKSKYRGIRKESIQHFQSLQKMKEGKINSIFADLKKALYKYNDSVRKLDLYHNDLIPKSELWLKIAETSYQTGTLDILNYIDTQRTLLEFQLNAERALKDISTEIAEIEMLTGKELPKKPIVFNRKEKNDEITNF